jgi:hypothetical protein
MAKKEGRVRRFARKHPIMSGMLAASGVAVAGQLGALPMLARTMKGIQNTGGAPVPGVGVIGKYSHSSHLDGVFKAAEKLYPQTKGVKRDVGMEALKAGGGAFGHGPLARASRFTSIQLAAAKRQPLGSEAVKEAFNMKPTVMLTPGQSRAVAAHELGHAAHHLGRRKKTKAAIHGFTRPLATEGLVGIGAIAAQPAISKSNLSEKNKNRLRAATIAAPLAVGAPMLADEAMASIRGVKILREAKALKARHVGGLTAAFGTYAGMVGGQAAGAAVAAKGYRARERKQRDYLKSFTKRRSA